MKQGIFRVLRAEVMLRVNIGAGTADENYWKSKLTKIIWDNLPHSKVSSVSIPKITVTER